MPSRVQVRELSEAEFATWSNLLERSPQGSAYGHPEYLAALCEAVGGAYRIVGAFLNGELVGGVPLFERRRRTLKIVSNRPLLYYNGIVLNLPPKKSHSDRTAQEQSIVGALAKDIAARDFAHVRLHNDPTLTDVRPFQAAGWQASISYTYVVSLTDLAAQWERVDPNLRRLIGRCGREGVVYREDDDFDSLFRLHWQTHRRKGATLYLPAAAFRRFYERVRQSGLARLGHAVFRDRVIASQLMLTGHHRVSHTVCAGADEDYLRMGASAFLRWKAFGALQNDGFLANDLTDASLNPVTRFKSQLGGTLTATYSVSRTDSAVFSIVTAGGRAKAWIADRSSRRRRRGDG